jgi:hypothetical protein
MPQCYAARDNYHRQYYHNQTKQISLFRDTARIFHLLVLIAPNSEAPGSPCLLIQALTEKRPDLSFITEHESWPFLLFPGCPAEGRMAG